MAALAILLALHTGRFPSSLGGMGASSTHLIAYTGAGYRLRRSNAGQDE
jgi:hypothetical protein